MRSMRTIFFIPLLFLAGCCGDPFTPEHEDMFRDEFDRASEGTTLTFLDCEEYLDGISEPDHEQPGDVCTGSCYL